MGSAGAEDAGAQNFDADVLEEATETDDEAVVFPVSIPIKSGESECECLHT